MKEGGVPAIIAPVELCVGGLFVSSAEESSGIGKTVCVTCPYELVVRVVNVDISNTLAEELEDVE